MKAFNLIGLAVISALLAMPTCGMWNAMITSAAHHDCHGKQEEQDNQKALSCCEQQALYVQEFHAGPSHASSHSPKSTTITSEFSFQPLETSPAEPVTTGDRLAKLSVLRI